MFIEANYPEPNYAKKLKCKTLFRAIILSYIIKNPGFCQDKANFMFIVLSILIILYPVCGLNRESVVRSSLHSFKHWHGKDFSGSRIFWLGCCQLVYNFMQNIVELIALLFV